MRNFLHLTIDTDQNYNQPALTQLLGSTSAVEYVTGSWLIDTDESATDWTTRVQRALGDSIQFVVFEAELDERLVDKYPATIRTFWDQRKVA